MKIIITQGINNCSLFCCESDKNNNLSTAVKFLNHFPKNQKQSVIISDLELIGSAEIFEQHNIRFIVIAKNDRKKHDVNIVFFNTIADLIRAITATKPCDDTKFFTNENILVFGKSEFMPIVECLELQSRPTHFEINLDALAYNINYFRSKLKPNTKMLCVLKANSYGTGNYETACLMQMTGVDYLGVAATDEGVALRKAGIKLPIIVFTPEIDNLEMMIRYDLEPEIHNFRSLQAFDAVCKKMKKIDYPIHIKINTGMNRQGFNASQIDELLAIFKKLKKPKYVKVYSIFTHIATADDYALEQLKLFDLISKKFQFVLSCKIIRHALNSVGIFTFPEHQLDMVRLGIGMYGISDFASHETKLVGKLTGVITQIETVAAGEAIGYGREGKIGETPKTIGVVSIGYADGFNRRLGKGETYFYVNGSKAPTIGNVCMDLTMIDLTGINASEGDRVEIFGDSPTAIDIANSLDTISYEVFTSVATRVKRIYSITI